MKMEVIEIVKDFQERVVGELSDLKIKIGKLIPFLESDVYKTLPKAEQDRLVTQLIFMSGYARVLQQRIESFA
jgi:hypothetical protein